MSKEVAPRDRLLMPLLQRLTDLEPDRKQESRQDHVWIPSKMRRAILDDLRALLNTTCHLSEKQIADYPEVAASVVNYGLPDLCGLTASGVSSQRIEKMIQTAIKRFEPRVLSGSLQVRAQNTDGAMDETIVLEIKGEVFSVPMPDALFIKTQLDLETGSYELKES